MKRTMGILIPAEHNAFTALSLLGKTCHAHVEQALTDAGVSLAATAPADAATLRALVAEDVSTVLLVNGSAPCLNAKTFRALLAAAASRPSAVLLADMQTPLAMAFPATMLRELPVARVTLETLIQALNERGIAVKVVHAQDPAAYFAVTDATSYAVAFRYLRDAILQKHLAGGVIVLEPERTVIEANVRIGAGTVIYANNTLQNDTVIGEGCTLYPGNRMDGATVGDGVTVESSVLIRCKVGAHTSVGPFAYLRPDAVIGEHCRIGDFVEIKNSTIGDGTKVSHLTYVGDSDLGKDINLGCGVVFVNYDGKIKNRSRVDDHAFIGCNCNLIAPVHVGENAYLAAGSTVVEDVPDNALFVARSRGVIKEDWVKRRKEQGKL